MRKNKVIVRERDAKHRPRQHAHDGALKADCFFGIHVDVANSAAPNAFGGRLCNQLRIYRRLPAKRFAP